MRRSDHHASHVVGHRLATLLGQEENPQDLHIGRLVYAAFIGWWHKSRGNHVSLTRVQVIFTGLVGLQYLKTHVGLGQHITELRPDQISEFLHVSI